MTIIDAALIAQCRSDIDSKFGPIPSDLSGPQQAAVNTARDNLAFCLATSGKYVRDNGSVVATGADPQGGVVNSTGTVT